MFHLNVWVKMGSEINNFISFHISSIVPKTWGKWIPIVRQKYRKTEHSKVKGFLYILREARIYTISKTWENWIPYSTGKLWENKNIPRVWVSYIFHVKQKSIQFPSDGTSEFPYYRTSMGKHIPSRGKNIPKSAVSYIFCAKQKSKQFPKHGKSEFP